MKNSKKNRLSYLLLGLMTFSFAGFCSCSQNQKDIKEEIIEVPEYEPLTEIIEGRKDVYFIVKNLSSSYWQVIMRATADAGNDFNCNIYCGGTNSETDWEIQEKLIDDAVSKRADAIVLAPDDSVRLAQKVSDIYKSGMPVVLVDTVVNTENYDVCYMTDNLMAGQKAAAEMIASLKQSGVNDNEEAKIAIQVGATSSQTITERLAGFCQYWTKNAPAKWKIIDDVKCNQGKIDIAVKCAEDFFKEYSDIKGVFGTNNGSTVGFARYILENELTDINIVGFDYSEEMEKLVNDERYTASTMLQRQYMMGYTGVQTALEIADGAEYDVKFVDTGVVAVNHQNMNEPEIKQLIEQN